MTLKVGSEVSTNGEEMVSLRGTGRVYERDNEGGIGDAGELVGVSR